MEHGEGRIERFQGQGVAVSTTDDPVRSLTWCEHLWMCIPIVFVLTGGVLGLLVGITAIYTGARIFRGRRSTISKYGLSALVSVAAVLAFHVLVGIAEVLVSGAGCG